MPLHFLHFVRPSHPDRRRTMSSRERLAASPSPVSRKAPRVSMHLTQAPRSATQIGSDRYPAPRVSLLPNRSPNRSPCRFPALGIRPRAPSLPAAGGDTSGSSQSSSAYRYDDTIRLRSRVPTSDHEPSSRRKPRRTPPRRQTVRSAHYAVPTAPPPTTEGTTTASSLPSSPDRSCHTAFRRGRERRS